jgi:hypothetical protein
MAESTVRGGPEAARGGERKHLQNDEVVHYALHHSDLFYPFLALSE